MGLRNSRKCFAGVWAGPDIDGRLTWYAVCRCGWTGRNSLDRTAAAREAAGHARTVRR